MSNGRLCQVEYGGQGGLLRYCGSVAAQLEAPQLVITAHDADLTYLPPNAAAARVLPWRGKGGLRTAIDIAYAETLLRREIQRITSISPVLIHIGVLFPPLADRVIHLIHDPDPRPLGGSERIARWALRRRLRGSGWTATHAPEFGFDAQRRHLSFPLPLGPASFAPRTIAVADAFNCEIDQDSPRVLCFGRAATPQGLSNLIAALKRHPSDVRVLVLAMGRSLTDSESLDGNLRIITRHGMVPNDQLDSLVTQATAIAVPHSGYPRSASGILALAAHHGVNALIGEAVDPTLVHDASRFSFRLQREAELNQALFGATVDHPAERRRDWGRAFSSLLQEAGV